jgi:hypothetical protein
MGYGTGAELVQVKRDETGAWSTATIWKYPNVLKTKFGNVVIRDGYIYGLSDTILQCVELDSGHVKWKKRRTPSFGYGQILLVGESIVALTESGEIVLFEATPKKYVEQASLQALEGITWNNPALAGSRLLVRNAEEAVCYELPLLGETQSPSAAGGSTPRSDYGALSSSQSSTTTCRTNGARKSAARAGRIVASQGRRAMLVTAFMP